MRTGSSSRPCPLHLSPAEWGIHSSRQQTPDPFQGHEPPQTHITPLNQPETMPACAAAASPGLINSLPSCASVSLPWPLSEATGAAQNDFRASVTKHRMHRAGSPRKLQLKPLRAIQRSSQPQCPRPPHPTSWRAVPLPVLRRGPRFWRPAHPMGKQPLGRSPGRHRSPPCTLLSLCSTCFPTGKPFPKGLFFHVNSVS